MTRENMFADAARADWMTDALLDQLRACARDGTVACADAQRFARENGIALEDMRALMDVAQVKVGRCQLGCF
jgi:hypothetical protein